MEQSFIGGAVTILSGREGRTCSGAFALRAVTAAALPAEEARAGGRVFAARIWVYRSCAAVLARKAQRQQENERSEPLPAHGRKLCHTLSHRRN
jgi:hypothetical protein